MTGIPILFRGDPGRDPDEPDGYAVFFAVLIVLSGLALVGFIAYEVIT